MSNTLRKTRTFTRDVVAVVPDGDGETRVPFKATFELVAQQEVIGQKDEAVLRRCLKRVDGLCDENGLPLPAQDQIDDVIGSTPAAAAAIRVYLDAVTRVEQGNSKK